MIANPVVYDGDEQALVDAMLTEYGFDGTFWGKEELDELKSRTKQHYIREQNYRCCYCQQPLYAHHGRVWDLEHVIARATRCDFMFVPRNLAVACVECNQAKGVVPVADPSRRSFPDRADLYRIVHPHFHTWEDHIELEGEGTYHALSPEGKFTIYHCDLFRFRERVLGTRQPIRDRRFERDIGELRLAKSPAEARPIIASIMARLEIEDERRQSADGSV
ncbi:HNH endonuclease [Mesorhizobium sp. M3A.F.Ca.ET.080.04.2.1]|uniref:HNH endonuclease n=1 Tax=Mesorhizobium sp. M3A.F.Ca.ET.080.04.2.1 TaxID=2493676 RepID=UPI000F756475|nr:HNH endonuclease [Mesorhizobium sp. M3A.F.Ca.ET.080.04.2.1]AZO07941.1 HNH endonuclease [Mesorhizobium sp. M3A.F.Ca.ET.080.04.2.1]RWF18407.1 MAG: HNH endonuclease [Mesorhizobium sp.]